MRSTPSCYSRRNVQSTRWASIRLWAISFDSSPISAATPAGRQAVPRRHRHRPRTRQDRFARRGPATAEGKLTNAQTSSPPSGRRRRYISARRRHRRGRRRRQRSHRRTRRKRRGGRRRNAIPVVIAVPSIADVDAARAAPRHALQAPATRLAARTFALATARLCPRFGNARARDDERERRNNGEHGEQRSEAHPPDVRVVATWRKRADRVRLPLSARRRGAPSTRFGGDRRREAAARGGTL